MSTAAGRFEVPGDAVRAAGQVLASAQAVFGEGIDWVEVFEGLLRATVPLLVFIDPPISQRQDELDGEYVLSIRAQRDAAEKAAEHSSKLSALVDESMVLVRAQQRVAEMHIAHLEAPEPAQTIDMQADWEDLDATPPDAEKGH